MNFKNLITERDSLNLKISFQLNELITERDLMKVELAEIKRTIDRNSKLQQDNTGQLSIWKEIVMNERDELKVEVNKKTTEVVELKDQLFNANNQQQKDREEIEKLKNELTEAKRDQRTMQNSLLEPKVEINEQQEEEKVESFDEVLECRFRDRYYDASIGTLYTCFVTSLDNSKNNKTIIGHSGVHLTNKSDADVKAIFIHNTNTKFIPTNLGCLFNLKALWIQSSQLDEIKYNDFHGMQELEYLSLSGNQSTSLAVDVFRMLTKLKIVKLSQNKIQELPKDIFDNNLNLRQIFLAGNKIKFIPTGLFDSLTKLKLVDLRRNIWIHRYYQGSSGINELKHDIQKMNNK